MSILNVLLRSDQLLIAVDTWAKDALNQQPSVGAKLLLIPQPTCCWPVAAPLSSF